MNGPEWMPARRFSQKPNVIGVAPVRPRVGNQTMYLDFDKPRHKAWKRVAVLIVALLFICLGCMLALMLPTDRLLQHCLKWLLSLLFAGAGLWLLVVAFLGDGRQVEKKLDELSDGM